jgi:hypothetical protein
LGLSQSGEDLNPQRKRRFLELRSPDLLNYVYAVADVLVDEGCF